MASASGGDETDSGALRTRPRAAAAGQRERAGPPIAPRARRGGKVPAGSSEVWAGREVTIRRGDLHAGQRRWTVPDDNQPVVFRNAGRGLHEQRRRPTCRGGYKRRIHKFNGATSRVWFRWAG